MYVFAVIMGKKKNITNPTLNVSRVHHDEEESARDLSRDSNQSITGARIVRDVFTFR